MRDLVILVADKDMEQAIKGLLERSALLGINESITWDVFVHPRRDPGCLNEAHEILRPLSAIYRYALVLFDHEGCGREGTGPDDLQATVRDRLERNGWPARSEVVVLAPELEVWVWSRSPHVAACLGWGCQQPPLRDWLAAEGYWPAEAAKPDRPKEAMEAALRRVRKPMSSAIYLDLARKVSLVGHSEPAFLHFTRTLRPGFQGRQVLGPRPGRRPRRTPPEALAWRRSGLGSLWLQAWPLRRVLHDEAELEDLCPQRIRFGELLLPAQGRALLGQGHRLLLVRLRADLD